MATQLLRDLAHFVAQRISMVPGGKLLVKTTKFILEILLFLVSPDAVRSFVSCPAKKENPSQTARKIEKKRSIGDLSGEEEEVSREKRCKHNCSLPQNLSRAECEEKETTAHPNQDRRDTEKKEEGDNKDRKEGCIPKMWSPKPKIDFSSKSPFESVESNHENLRHAEEQKQKIVAEKSKERDVRIDGNTKGNIEHPDTTSKGTTGAIDPDLKNGVRLTGINGYSSAETLEDMITSLSNLIGEPSTIKAESKQKCDLDLSTATASDAKSNSTDVSIPDNIETPKNICEVIEDIEDTTSVSISGDKENVQCEIIDLARKFEKNKEQNGEERREPVEIPEYSPQEMVAMKEIFDNMLTSTDQLTRNSMNPEESAKRERMASIVSSALQEATGMINLSQGGNELLNVNMKNKKDNTSRNRNEPDPTVYSDKSSFLMNFTLFPLEKKASKSNNDKKSVSSSNGSQCSPVPNRSGAEQKKSTLDTPDTPDSKPEEQSSPRKILSKLFRRSKPTSDSVTSPSACGSGSDFNNSGNIEIESEKSAAESVQENFNDEVESSEEAEELPSFTDVQERLKVSP